MRVFLLWTLYAALILFSGGIIFFVFFFPNKWIILSPPHAPVSSYKPTPTSLPIESIHIPVLLYHYVEYVKDVKDTIRQSLDITPNVFEKQIVTLQKAGYQFLTMSDVGEILDGKRHTSDKVVALTFDDGYGDFYTDVFPVLKKYSIRATIFMVSGFLDRPNFMTTQQFLEVAQDGHVEIGAHTVHHLNLKGQTRDVVDREIRGSKIALEKLIHMPVLSFAYPYGGFDTQAEMLTREVGFMTAVTTQKGETITNAGRYRLPRVRPGVRTGEGLLKYIQ